MSIKFSYYLEQHGLYGDDALYVTEYANAVWFCVSDGAGGTGSGDIASAYIINEFKSFLTQNEALTLIDFEQFLGKLDNKVCQHADGGEATAVIGKVDGQQVTGASVGDSVAWMFGRSFSDLTQAQNRKPLLGSSNAKPVGFHSPIDDYILIASDGFSNYANFSHIQSQLSLGATSLASLARLPNGKLQDDLAIILIETGF